MCVKRILKIARGVEGFLAVNINIMLEWSTVHGSGRSVRAFVRTLQTSFH